jgi:nucleotide-binding universal stress UspA family protein
MGITVSFLVWTGDPGESIVSAAEAESADLVVVGTHGRGTIGRLLLGSVSDHVVRNAPCPVLVVRPASRGSSRPAAA